VASRSPQKSKSEDAHPTDATYQANSAASGAQATGDKDKTDKASEHHYHHHNHHHQQQQQQQHAHVHKDEHSNGPSSSSVNFSNASNASTNNPVLNATIEDINRFYKHELASQILLPIPHAEVLFCCSFGLFFYMIFYCFEIRIF
jgi:hypothetical protein